jgi:2'-5' RNA ligase
MSVKYTPAKNLFDQLSLLTNKKLKNREEAHITVVTPVEYFNVLKHHISIKQINNIAKNYYLQSSSFEVICLGKGSVKLSKQIEENYFIVINSEDLITIREEIKKAFIQNGGNPDLFSAEHYYPHITLGFTKRDLHEYDGIIKDSRSCIAHIKIN